MFADKTDVISVVKRISETLICENAERVDQASIWPESSLRALQRSGIAGLTIPVEYGGLGAGTKLLAQVSEILGQYCANTALCFGAHAVASAAISARPTPLQQREYLTPICQGQHLTSLAFRETGSQFYLPKTRMQNHTISGTKFSVINGHQADSYIVSAVTDTDMVQTKQFNCFLVGANTVGLSWQPQRQSLGLKGSSLCDLKLDRVKVYQKDMLGQLGDQIWYIFNVITPYFLSVIAGICLGMAKSAIEEVERHIIDREFPFNGRPMASSSVIQFQLGCLWAKYARARSLIYYATERYDQDHENALIDLFSAKAEIAESLIDIINESITFCGDSAYRQDIKLERLLRDTRTLSVIPPTTDTLRVWTGRTLLEQPLLSDI